MGTLVKKVKITIDTKDNEKGYENYNFLNIVLSQQLLSPNQLRFTMQMKDISKSTQGELYYIPDKLMGEKISCEIETQRFRSDTDMLEEETEFIQFKGIIFNAKVYTRTNMASEKLIDVIAYSPDYLLIDHPHCFSYENDTLKKIVKATLDPYDISNDVNPRTTASIPYTVQYNESNYQFLTRLAKRYGEWMYHNGEKLIFGKIKKLNEKEPIKLRARNDIKNFHLQTDIVHHKVKHAHHDYLKYENSMKSHSEFNLTASFHRLTDEAKSKSESLYKKETFQHLQCSNPEGDGKNPGNPIDELEVSAKAQLFGEKTLQTVCNGSSVRSDLTIGSCIRIGDHFLDGNKNMKQYFEDMLIINITHYAETDGEYSNSFTAVPSKTEYPPYYQSDIFPFASAQRAKVKENDDKEHLGRVRVQFLWQEMQDETLKTPWIRMAQPHGGNDKGFFFIPEIGEEVMVDFENGNAEKPYVVGTLYHGQQHLGDNWYPGSNEVKAIRTQNGHTIEIHDKGKGKGGFIRIYDHDQENYSLTFSTDGKTKIELKSKGDIELHAAKNIKITADEDIDIEAGQKITLTAKSSMILDSGGSLDAKAKGTTTIKGAMVNIN